jgi:hypothetical protein
VIHLETRRSRKWSTVETDVCVVCTVSMEIRTRLDLKHTKACEGSQLRGETTETMPLVDAVWMRHKLTSEKIKLNENDRS